METVCYGYAYSEQRPQSAWSRTDDEQTLTLQVRLSIAIGYTLHKIEKYEGVDELNGIVEALDDMICIKT